MSTISCSTIRILTSLVASVMVKGLRKVCLVSFILNICKEKSNVFKCNAITVTFLQDCNSILPPLQECKCNLLHGSITLNATCYSNSITCNVTSQTCQFHP